MRFWRRFSHDHDALVCREFVELVTDYLAGALPEHESVRFEAHLAECDSCASYLQDMRRIVDTCTKCGTSSRSGPTRCSPPDARGS